MGKPSYFGLLRSMEKRRRRLGMKKMRKRCLKRLSYEEMEKLRLEDG